MTKRMRVYEYAKQMNMSSKEVLTILERMDMKVNNHMSVMEEAMVQKVEEFLHNLRQGTPPVPKKEAPKQEAPKKEAPKKVAQEKVALKKEVPKREPLKKASTRKEMPKRSPQKSADKPGDKRTSSRPAQQRTPNESKGGSAKPADGDLRISSGVTRGPRKQETRWSSESADQKRKGKSSFSNQNKSRDGYRSGDIDRRNRRKPDRRGQKKEEIVTVLPKKIEVSGPLTVGEFARHLRKEASEVIRKLIDLGVMVTINQEIDIDTMMLLGEEFHIPVVYKEFVDESTFEEMEEVDAPEDLIERPPVVTIMGHVDHGKTTLLDRIRQSKITQGEAGGITQHIGAYQVEVKSKRITFLDTPGHAAFTTMRARGAQITDITILVVAADDGVMPQTIEAINHAKAAEVPFIVALNKMDKPEANPDRVKQQLADHGLISEEWGGDTIFVPVSAKTGEGIDDLLDTILLVAEVQEYKANPNKRSRGVVIEARLDKEKGAIASVLVQNGTLKIGDGIVAGNYFGKIRAMTNDRGRRIKEATPSMPVEILGLPDVPAAGDPFMVFEDEKKGRAISDKRTSKHREQSRVSSQRVTLDDLFKQIEQGDVKELNVIIKADVQGSAEAMKSSLEKIEVEEVRVKIIHSGVGAITESDIILASASGAIIIGFNVRIEPNARAMAEQERVDIRLHRVIYNAISEIEAAMTGLLDPEYEEKEIGMAEVRQIFKVSKIGTIAGCYVTEGKITRDAKIRLLRDSVVIHEGSLDTLKRFKDDVKEVVQGYECGLTLEGYHDLKEGDMIEAYVIEEVKRT